MTDAERSDRPTDDNILDRLAADSRDVLDANWLTGSTLPSRSLYPHQWNWDSAFISIGRSWYDEGRAHQELRSLFDAQWANGKVPSIVFNPSVAEDAYFPGPAFWQTSTRSASAPKHVETSGITQPPLHARAALEMHRHAKDVEGSKAFLAEMYPKFVAEHDYLVRHRDPTGIGLPAVMHPWESGLDNSPVWDRDLTEMVIPDGAVPPYVRHDLEHGDPKDRPTNEAYDRFVFLAARYRDSGYDDAVLVDTVPFLVSGPLFNSIHLWSEHALADIARIIGQDPTPHKETAERIHDALTTELWDSDMNRFCALDVVRRERSAEDTIVSFLPLLDPALPKHQVQAIVADLHSASFHPDAKISFVVPSYDLLSKGFDERQYWRGPIWINTNWMLIEGLRQHGYHSLADQVALSSLRLVAKSGFREYFDPFDGTGFGTTGFGWTAALTLDLVERQHGAERARLAEQLRTT
jgi:hypothetical protein